jgi:hypothetical protein
MPYSANKTIDGLDAITGDAAATDSTILSRAGNTYRATLDKVLNYVFGSKTEQTVTNGSDIVIIKRGSAINQAQLSNLMPDSAISTAKLAGNAVTSAKLASSANSGDRAVGVNHIQDSAVQTSHIAGGAVIDSKMATDSVGNSALKADAVTDSKILAGTISSSKFSQTAADGPMSGNFRRIVSLLNPPAFNSWETYSKTTNLPNTSLAHYRTFNRTLGRQALNIITPKTTFPGGTGTSGAFGGAFSGSVVLPDGRIFLVPFNHNEVWIYDPILDSYTVPAQPSPALTSQSQLFMGGILMPPQDNGTYTTNGHRVLCIPYNRKRVLIYDCITNTLSWGGSGDTSSLANKAFCGGVLLPIEAGVNSQRKAFLAPYDNNQAFLVDYSGALSVISAVNLTNPRAHGAFLNSQGNAVCYTSTGRYQYDSTTAIHNLSIVAGQSCYPVPTADGHAVLIPVVGASASVTRVVDTTNSSVTTHGGISGNSFGAVRFPCGTILALGMGSRLGGSLIDETDTSTPSVPLSITAAFNSQSYNGGGANGGLETDLGRSPFSGGVLLPDGRAFITPCTSTTARIISLRTSVCPPDWNVILGPNNNKL